MSNLKGKGWNVVPNDWVRLGRLIKRLASSVIPTLEEKTDDLQDQIDNLDLDVTIESDLPLFYGLNFRYENIAGTSYIKWDAGTVTYKGETYNIRAGSSTSQWVMLQVNDLSVPGGTYSLRTTEGPTVVAGLWYLAYMSGGNVYPAFQSTIINGGLIQGNTITASQIKAGTLTADRIVNNTLTSAQIAAGTITANEIASNTITASNIAANTITAAKVATNTFVAQYAGKYNSLAGGATDASRVEIFPDANTGIKITKDTSNEVFKALVGGADAGDVIIGNYSGGTGAKWDQSAGTFDIKGSVTAGSVTASIITGGIITGQIASNAVSVVDYDSAVEGSPPGAFNGTSWTEYSGVSVSVTGTNTTGEKIAIEGWVVLNNSSTTTPVKVTAAIFKDSDTTPIESYVTDSFYMNCPAYGSVSIPVSATQSTFSGTRTYKIKIKIVDSGVSPWGTTLNKCAAFLRAYQLKR